LFFPDLDPSSDLAPFFSHQPRPPPEVTNSFCVVPFCTVSHEEGTLAAGTRAFLFWVPFFRSPPLKIPLFCLPECRFFFFLTRNPLFLSLVRLKKGLLRSRRGDSFFSFSSNHFASGQTFLFRPPSIPYNMVIFFFFFHTFCFLRVLIDLFHQIAPPFFASRCRLFFFQFFLPDPDHPPSLRRLKDFFPPDPLKGARKGLPWTLVILSFRLKIWLIPLNSFSFQCPPLFPCTP